MTRNLQFSTSYLGVEDRLLLQASFPDETEIKLLLTRRMTRGLLQAMDKLSEALVRGDVARPEVKRQVASFTREAAVDQADFSQKYVQGRPHPYMAGGPRLVTEVSLTPESGEQVAVQLKLDKGERLKFALPASALWSLAHLVEQQAEKAGWGIGASKAERQAPGAAQDRLN